MFFVRQWLIKKLCGKMTVVMNTTIEGRLLLTGNRAIVRNTVMSSK